MTRRQSKYLLSALTLICIMASGCGTRLTAEKFKKIEEGMSLADVKSILGKPDNTVKMSSTGEIHGWQSGDRIVIVMMLDGEVISTGQENVQ